MQGNTPIDPDVVTNQYDALLQTVEKGLILTVNHNQPHMISSEELTVIESCDDETNVRLSGHGDSQYRICRDESGELVYGELTSTGFKLEDTVITLEILGQKQ